MSPYLFDLGVSLSLLTDLYQLTMGFGYWKSGIHEAEAVFHLTYRTNPFGGGYAVSCGLGSLIDYIKNYSFKEDDIEYLKTLNGEDCKPLFSEEYLDYLKNLRFSCDIDAIIEGSIVFPHEPLLRVKGPLIQCQLIETAILNLINFQTLIATKASRVCRAAKGDPVVEFGVRRAQGPDGALSASRAAFIGGCVATSNLLAGKIYKIPVKGTQAHSWIMAFDSESEAFEAYSKALPNNCIFLVDTYNTLEGVKRAIEVGKALRSKGKPFLGIRLDSGDFAYLSKEARKLLDEADFCNTVISASNELDERIIQDLKHQGSPITLWGVGTHLVTARDDPALNGVYKLSSIKKGSFWQDKLKLSEQMVKINHPGILQVKRYHDDQEYLGDAIYDIRDTLDDNVQIIDPLDPTKSKSFGDLSTSKDLLQPIFKKGQLVYKQPSMESLQKHVNEELSKVHEGVKRFIYPHLYPVGLERSLYDKKVELIQAIRQNRGNKV